MPFSGKRSAAPTRDTAEPALPGRWCRPLEGGDRLHAVSLGGGGHILPGRWCRPLEGGDRRHVSASGRGWAHPAGVGMFWGGLNYCVVLHQQRPCVACHIAHFQLQGVGLDGGFGQGYVGPGYGVAVGEAVQVDPDGGFRFCIHRAP